MKKIAIMLLLLISCSAITHSIGLGGEQDINAVHKWELWDSELNVSTTTKSPYMRTGNTYLSQELIDAGLESSFSGIMAISNTTEIPLMAMSHSTNSSSDAAAAILNYGEHDNFGGSNVFSVYRVCNITNSGFCNFGPIAGFGDLSNTLFPNEAVDISSDVPGASQVMRINGYFLDPYTKVLYIANTNNSMAIEVDDSSVVCTNLNADYLDSYHASDIIAMIPVPVTTLPAENITAGTFGAGDFVFPNNLNVTGDLVVLGNITGGSPAKFREGIISYDNVTVYGNVSADYFVGDGSLLTNIPSSSFDDTGLLYQNGTRSMTGDLNLGGHILTTATDVILKPGSVGGYIEFLNSTGITVQTLFTENGQMFLYNSAGTNYVTLQHIGGFGYLGTSSGDMNIDPASGNVIIGNAGSGVIQIPRIYASTSANPANVYVDSSGNLYRATLSSSFDDTGLLYQNGTRALTGNWDVGQYTITNTSSVGVKNTGSLGNAKVQIDVTGGTHPFHNSGSYKIVMNDGHTFSINYDGTAAISTTDGSIGIYPASLNTYTYSILPQTDNTYELGHKADGGNPNDLYWKNINMKGNLVFGTANTTDIGTSSSYANEVYAYQYYGKNDTILSFDDYEDTGLVRNISPQVGNEKYFEMPEVLFDNITEYYNKTMIDKGIAKNITEEINTTSLNMGKVIGLAYGTLKELIVRDDELTSEIDWLTIENQRLKEKLDKICSENQLKGCI